MSESRWIIVDDELIESGSPVLPAESRAVRYGEGCFETLRSYQGTFLKFSEHLDRLNRGMQYLEISKPGALRYPELLRSINDLLEKNGLEQEEALVRIQVWSEGDRGYAVSGEQPGHYTITATPLPDIPSTVSLATVSVRRISSLSLDSTLKLSNGINYIRASTEAREQGADDALMQTIDGFISETPIANIFWYGDGTVYTPSVECDLLPGITRGLLLDLIEHSKEVKLSKGKFEVKNLESAEACWICNSVREIVPVSEVDEIRFDTDHQVIRNLEMQFRDSIEKLKKE